MMKTRLDSYANRLTSFQDKKITFLSLDGWFKGIIYSLLIHMGVFLLSRYRKGRYPKNHGDGDGLAVKVIKVISYTDGTNNAIPSFLGGKNIAFIS
ncbi:hypothetical protein [Pectobacterium peruviense]|uniref:hypothetical protein n=1 Tax=Pectobacterium peruviense TaxID=2066479 RepID=UPI000DE35DF8|nr:hypothetical protein [Pectobacterium peruviense]